jgi:peroxiredoxin
MTGIGNQNCHSDPTRSKMSDMATSSRLQVGDPAPTLQLTGAGGESVAVQPAGNAATVVVFTSNGCPYALAWHDRIQDVARDYADRGVVLVQVLSNDAELQPLDSADEMAARVARGEVSGAMLRDETQSAARQFGATATPEVYVTDRDGVVRYHGAPDADYDNPALRAEWLRASLDAVLDDREPALPSTPPAGCAVKWRVELLWWVGCPSHHRAEELLIHTLGEIQREDVRVERIEVSSTGEASLRHVPGSPSFQVGGADLFPQPDAAPALACRTYTLEDGRISPLPSEAQLAAGLREALVRPWELPGWVDFRKQAAQS